MTTPKDHQRVNDILLGPIERPALRWLAAHSPAWMTPDHLTAIGTFGAFVIFASYALSGINPAFLWLASLGLLINWYGDSLDGTLARYRNIQRPKYGFFVDHTVDAFNEMLIVLGLGLSPYISFDVAALALVGYLLMSVFVYVRTFVDGVFQISYSKFGPTEVRVILAILNTLMFFFVAPTVTLPFGTVTLYDGVVGLIAAILIVLFVVSSWQKAKELSQIDQRPASPTQ
ncbi:MAG: CDP-alcohol phosphatidyltransferase family protein [Anaerolineae bacterium]|nr:CDP-alcohol phosphatidyltransferase family protein [Anaerolineae bacterium]